MLGEIGPVVTPRIEMKFMWDMARVEQIMKGLRAVVKPEIIFGAAVEIDREPRWARTIAHDRER